MLASCLFAFLSLLLQVSCNSQLQAVDPALPTLELHWCAILPLSYCLNQDWKGNDTSVGLLFSFLMTVRAGTFA